MKKYKVMMVAVLGIIVLVLTLSLMPAVTTTPTNRRRGIQLKELARWV
jgi:hypothetical protein